MDEIQKKIDEELALIDKSNEEASVLEDQILKLAPSVHE